jgi:hypothetical protein
MGLFGFFKKDARNNHTFDEKDRDLAVTARRQRAELDNLRREQEIEELRMKHDIRMAELQADMEDLVGEDAAPQGDGMSPEDRIAMKLIDKIGERKTPPPAATPQGAKEYTEEELKAKWADVPPVYKAVAKQSTDEQIKEYLHVRLLPDANPESINRALQVIRTTS